MIKEYGVFSQATGEVRLVMTAYSEAVVEMNLKAGEGFAEIPAGTGVLPDRLWWNSVTEQIEAISP